MIEINVPQICALVAAQSKVSCDFDHRVLPQFKVDGCPFGVNSRLCIFLRSILEMDGYTWYHVRDGMWKLGIMGAARAGTSSLRLNV